MSYKKKILVVEGNDTEREELCGILSDEYDTIQADNGQAALNILKQQGESISLILMDVLMPVMDGFTFLKCIKEDKKLSEIPVIVITQSDSEEDELMTLAHVAIEFISKPYRPQIILHRISTLVKLRETDEAVNRLQHDSFTGFYTKEFFYKKALECLTKDPDGDYCIICSNIEHFKLLNDVLGVNEGNRLLKEVADISRQIAGDTGICGRFAKDRFVCLKKCDKGLDEVKACVGRVGEEISALFKTAIVRWGIYEITNRKHSIERMCDRAFLAAESIKKQYNRFLAVYDETLRNKLLRENTITSSMESAYKDGQFEVYFQPKYSLKNNSMAGAEALVRWIHPELGIMSPGEFIPLFEKNGFILNLDRCVWEQVCVLLSRWRGKGYPTVPVSVNVSRVDMYHEGLADEIFALVNKYGVAPSLLHLEITESAYAENPEKIINTAERFRKLGFIVEMDDFGSGYSSFNMLSQLPLDILKLDLEFIHNEIAKPVEHSMLCDVINMAHRAHLGVVAEGVENREQLVRLRLEKCDYVQGYCLAKPMPAAEFEKMLKTHKLIDENADSKIRQSYICHDSLLVVDEDAEYLKAASNAFKKQRYNVMEAQNAEQAIDYITSDFENRISAVVLSMALPGNGAELVLNALRKDSDFCDTPVLAVIPKGSRLSSYPLALEMDDFLCKCHPITDLNRKVKRMIDAVYFSSRECALIDEARRDPLTGLLNRRGFQDALTTIRNEDMPLAVCIFDLDDMKKVNDNYGHHMGDKTLCSFAELLCSLTDSEDIKCRYGGDEFVVLLKHINDSQSALDKGKEICRMFYEKTAKKGFSSACSAGIAICRSGERLSDGLLECADKALYQAKRSDKGSCCLWKD